VADKREPSSSAAVIHLLRRTVSHVLDAALPAACVGCGREGPPLCGACVPALDRRLDAPAGVPIGLPGDLPAPLLQLDWCAPFSGTVRSALHAIKYGGEQRLAEPLGAAVARRWARIGVGADVVAHVPVHVDRARTRGYDQAELIARAAARQLGLPYAPLLTRERATIAQFDLDRGDRAANVAGAFVAAHRRGQDPGGRWVLLVDDVVTTGATLAACAEALDRAGALGTSAITVARER
jgi:predicted amidophosphoribosyltransferase